TPTPTPTETPTPTPTETPTPTPTETPTPTPTETPTPTPTETPTPTPTETPTPSPTPYGPQKYWTISQGDATYGYKDPFQEEDWNYGNDASFDPSVIEVCPDITWKNGYAFFMTSRSFDEDLSFDARYTVQIDYASGTSGADGIAFVMSPNTVNNNTNGGSIGYGSITPSLIVELDNYANVGRHRNELGSSDWFNGENGNHVAVTLNGDATTHYAYIDWPELSKSGLKADIWVSYNGKEKNLYVYVANYDENGVVEKPIAPTLVCPIDLEAHFAGVSELYMGFTSSTGSARASHKLLGFELDPMPNMHNENPLLQEERYFIFSQGDAKYGYQTNFVKEDWDFGSYTSYSPELLTVCDHKSNIITTITSTASREFSPDYSFNGRFTVGMDYSGSSPSNTLELHFVSDSGKSIIIEMDFTRDNGRKWRDNTGEWHSGSTPYQCALTVDINGDYSVNYGIMDFAQFLDNGSVNEVWYEYDGAEEIFYLYTAQYDENGNIDRNVAPAIICPINFNDVFNGAHDLHFKWVGETYSNAPIFNVYGIELDPYPAIHQAHNRTIEIVRPENDSRVVLNSTFDVFGRIKGESENVYLSVFNADNEEVYSNVVPSSSTYTSFDEISTKGWKEGSYTLKVAIDDGTEETISLEVAEYPFLNLDLSSIILSSEGMDIVGTVECTKNSTYDLYYSAASPTDWQYIGSGTGNKIEEILGNIPLDQVPDDYIQIQLTVKAESGETETIIRQFEYNLDPFINPTPTPSTTGEPTPTPIPGSGEFTTDELFVDVDDKQDGMEVTYITDILGTVSGSLLSNYVFEVYAVESGELVYTCGGSSEILNGAVGTLDPTLLMNGYYQIKLTAYTSEGTGLYDEITVLVCGNAKIGNFSMSFNDMTTGLNNFPITIARTYDSRNLYEIGDFGYGWNMSIAGPSISVSGELNKGWSQANTSGLVGMQKYYWVEKSLHEVTIDWGNGKKDTFQLKLDPAEQYLKLRDNISASFVAKGSCTSTLEILDEHTGLMYDGSELYDLDMRAFSPKNFMLTTIDGVKYYFNIDTGLYKIEDTYGRTIGITNDGIFYSDGSGIEIIRDEEGKITSISDGVQSVHYSYDANGDLKEVENHAGATTSFAYTNHYLEEIVDPRGVRVARNEYDENGRLVATVDADGNRNVFEYDIDGKCEVVTNRLGFSTVYTYDDYGNVLSTTDALGRTTTNTFDENHHMSSSTDAMGNTTYYSYSADGDLLSITDADGMTRSWQYSSEGRVTSIVNDGDTALSIIYDKPGNMTSVSDADGNVTSFTYANNGDLTSMSDSIGTIMTLTYDTDGNIVSTTDADGSTTYFTYDEFGNVISRSATCDGKTVTDYFSYDMYGNLTTITYSDGTSEHFSYDQVGNCVSKLDVLGYMTEYSFDIQGNLIYVSYPDGTSESFSYDAEGQMLRSTDRLGIDTTYVYDAVGNLKKKESSNGLSISYTYDDCNRVITESNGFGGTTHYTYDAIGNTIKVTDDLGNATSYDYNDLGLVSCVTDANGHSTSFTYDANGNQTSITYADGSRYSAAYDARSRMTLACDAEGNSTVYDYDEMDHLVSATDPSGSTWKYDYDGFGNNTCVTDPNGNKTYYSYDKSGRLVSVTNAAGKSATVTYNQYGQTIKSTDFGGNETVYGYDSLGRIASVTTADDAILFDYNAAGSIEKVQDASGSISYSFTSDGNLASKKDENGKTVTYSYNSMGCVSTMTFEDKTVSYTYDTLGRLLSVEDENGNTTDYTYDKVGNLIETAYSNGVTTTYTYDEVNRLVYQETTDASGNVIASYRYTLGDNGERIKVEEQSRTIDYTYDSCERLISEKITNKNGDTTETVYAYDANSNRISKTVDGTSTSYTYNELNQLVSVGESDYTYDDAGNLVTIDVNGQLVGVYKYNSRNQLVESQNFTATGTVTTTYTYNYLGDRTSKTVNGVETAYTLDYSTGLSQVIAEETAGEVTCYVRGLELISREEKSETSFYVYDGTGSVCALTDEDGNLTDKYVFDVFGSEISHTGDSDNVYGFQGEMLDDETGFYYLRARYMNPTNGTFISMDTYAGELSDPVSLNHYLFANSNPIKYCDPTGHVSLEEEELVVSIISKLCEAEIDFARKLIDLELKAVSGQLTMSGYIQNLTVDIAEEKACNFLKSAIMGLLKMICPQLWALASALQAVKSIWDSASGLAATAFADGEGNSSVDNFLAVMDMVNGTKAVISSVRGAASGAQDIRDAVNDKGLIEVHVETSLGRVSFNVAEYDMWKWEQKHPGCGSLAYSNK
ncbi:MAG: hypothetical protein KBT07_08620, partial [Clostridiales bacterium]|nr:hypothetical protein [Candidatus Scatonaster coprocaballi]